MKDVTKGLEGRRRAPLAFNAKRAREIEPRSKASEAAGDSRGSKASGFDLGRVYALGADGPEDFPLRGAKRTTDPPARPRSGYGERGKLCTDCGSPMKRTSRMILSPSAGLMLLALGAVLMTGYGTATNFYQTPWFLKFALPAVYYIGSIFIGVGLLFFFIREKVWKCNNCREIRKR
jgi:hypothetical protein